MLLFWKISSQSIEMLRLFAPSSVLHMTLPLGSPGRAGREKQDCALVTPSSFTEAGAPLSSISSRLFGWMAATLPSILSQLSFPASSGAFSFLWTINRPVTTQSIAVRKAGNAFKQRKDLRGFCPPLPKYIWLGLVCKHSSLCMRKTLVQKHARMSSFALHKKKMRRCRSNRP